MPPSEGERRPEQRWPARPKLALLVRSLVFLVPLAAAAAAAIVAGRLLPPRESLGEALLWWVAVSAVTTVALIGMERVLRRLMPLAMLFKLTLVFPDRAPSRFAVARQAGRTKELERLVEEARERGLDSDPSRAAETILALVAALNVHDRRTRGHSERVRVFAEMLADELKIEGADRERLRWGSLLHDIGKLAVEPSILNKPGRPEPDEWEKLRSHPAEGARLIAPLRSWLDHWAWATRDHHEKFDGSGYPKGRSGRRITPGGRIAAIADCFETMTAARAYKRPMTVKDAREELVQCAGTHFDPAMVRAFLNIPIGKLWRALGPLAWLAQLPILRRSPDARVAGAVAPAAEIPLLARLARPGMSGRARPLGLAAVTATAVAALSVGGALGRTAEVFKDPQDVHSSSHEIGVASTNDNITMEWTRRADVSAYSIEWSNRKKLPDRVPDLDGQANGDSRKLPPGSWYFNLRTRSDRGRWTATVQKGPFIIGEEQSTAAPGPTPTARAAAPATRRPTPTRTPAPTPAPTSSPSPTTTPGINKIAFASDRNGNEEIYLMNPDGSSPRNLTNHPGVDFTPSWSPDERRILFTSNRDGNFDVYVMNVDGSGPTRLTDHAAEDFGPTWSPNGSRIAFTSMRSGNKDIWTMNVDGTDTVRLTNDPTHDFAPVWSPDGSKIAFVSDRNGGVGEIYVMNANGSGQTNISNNAATELSPAWSSDGRIAFLSDRNGTEVFVMNANGSGQQVVTSGGYSDPYYRWLGWSPDGARIVLTDEEAVVGNLEIFVVNSNGTGRTPITSNSAQDKKPEWSPRR